MPERSDAPAGARPPKLVYHSSPPSRRESIRRQGLSPEFSEAAELARETGLPDWRAYGSVFFSSAPEENLRVDVWAVEAGGLRLEPDDTTDCPNEGESWWQLRGRIIEPSRLTLLRPGYSMELVMK